MQQYLNDVFQYLDEHRTCLMFCDAVDHFNDIYDVFKLHEESYFPAYRITLYVIGGLTNTLMALTIFIILYYGRDLSKTYRNTMVFNSLLPALLTNHVCFVFQPYAIGPNFIIYSVGPIRGSCYTTAIQVCVFVLISAPFTFLLFAQLSYHAFIIIKPQKTLKLFWVNLVWYISATCSVGFNLIVFFLAVDRQHYRLEDKILAVEPKFQYILDNYAPFIIDIKTATIPMNIILLEAIYAILLFAVGMFWAAYKILRSYCKNRTLLSARLTTAQRHIVLMLLIYTTTYLGLLGFPSIAAGFIMLAGARVTFFPIAGLYFASSSFVAIAFCVINLLTVSPYRRAVRRLFTTLVPFFNGSSNSSTDTVIDSRLAVARASLFTRELPPG